MAYQYGTVSQDIRDIFSGVDTVGKDYVMWRNNQYDYCMFVGDEIIYNGSRFTSDSGFLYTYDTQSNQTQNNPISWTYRSSSLSLADNGVLVFTNVTDTYPALKGVTDHETNYLFLFALLICFFAWLISDIFSTVQLSKGRKSS